MLAAEEERLDIVNSIIKLEEGTAFPLIALTQPGLFIWELKSQLLIVCNIFITKFKFMIICLVIKSYFK